MQYCGSRRASSSGSGGIHAVWPADGCTVSSARAGSSAGSSPSIPPGDGGCGGGSGGGSSGFMVDLGCFFVSTRAVAGVLLSKCYGDFEARLQGLQIIFHGDGGSRVGTALRAVRRASVREEVGAAEPAHLPPAASLRSPRTARSAVPTAAAPPGSRLRSRSLRRSRAVRSVRL